MADIVTVIVGNVLRAGASGVLVIDDLTSSSNTAALSANQGRVLAEQIADLPTGGAVDSVNSKTGIVVLMKADIGLGNVDNTSDVNKPVSTATQTALNTKVNASSLAAVATSGLYSDLSGKPTLSTVAATGAYSDLTGKPTIPAAQVNSDWNSSAGLSQILNKPALATVAMTGAYSDLSGKPVTYVGATLPSDLTPYPDNTLFIIG